MHVERLETTTEAATVETVVTGVDLDYATVGPAFGEQVSDIEAGIEAGDYTVEDGTLRVTGVELGADMFELEEERQYTGEGEMVEAEGAVVVVEN